MTPVSSRSVGIVRAFWLVASLGALPLVAAFDVPPHPVDVILGRPTDRSVTVSVVAYQDGDGYVTYAADAAGAPAVTTPTRPLSSEDATELVLDGLRADTAYSYRFFFRSGSTGEYTATPAKTFRTARSAGADFTFTVQADSHLDGNTSTALYSRELANVAADAPDFHVDLGDTFMTDKYPVFTDARAQYYAQRYYLGLAGASAPLFLTLGNHDGELGYAVDGTAQSMPVWSAKLRTRLFPNPLPGGFYTGNATPEPSVGLLGDYYAFTWGDALFVVLDPFWPTRQKGNDSDNWSWTLGAEQYGWLRGVLESSRAKLKFVFLHHLVGGFGKDRRGGVEAAGLWEWGGANADGTYGFSARRPGWAEPIHGLLVRTGVSAVFHGHDHLYVRQTLDGIVYQEVPQPGFPRANSTSSAAEYGYTTGTVLGSSGHLRVRVVGGNATIEYVRALLPADETETRKNGDIVLSYSVPGRASDPVPVASWLLASSARAPGAGGSFYSTDLAIANVGASEATYTLKFLGHDVDGSAGAERTFTLGGGKTVTYQDVLGSVFGISSGYGAVRVAASTASLAVASQTWTPSASGGTFGQSVPAFGESELIKVGAPRVLTPVREDASFRTNLVLANATNSPLDVDVALVSESGASLGTRRYGLLPLGMTQMTRVVRDLGVTAEVAGARLVVSTATPGGAFAAYASLIDATTNDPRTLLPR